MRRPRIGSCDFLSKARLSADKPARPSTTPKKLLPSWNNLESKHRAIPVFQPDHGCPCATVNNAITTRWKEDKAEPDPPVKCCQVSGIHHHHHYLGGGAPMRGSPAPPPPHFGTVHRLSGHITRWNPRWPQLLRGRKILPVVG